MNTIARTIKKVSRTVITLVAVAMLALAPVAPTFATVNWPAPAPKVTFTFDDGLASAYTQAKPTLAKYGLTGTNYVITGCVGMTTAPNTCHANTDATYMTWAQVQDMQASGWEIGSHTVSHPYLATSDATDGQPKVLTPTQVDQELSQSKAALATHGIDATDFASPYGDYNNSTLAQTAKYYASQRGFQDVSNNVWAYNDYIINDMQVQAGVTVDQVKARIDDAIANNLWLVLTFHDIKVNASTDPTNYEYKTADLDAIAAYVKTKVTANQIKALNIKDGLVKSDTNLLSNGGFVNGFNTWSTNAPANIKADTGNNGAYPNPANAVSITGGTANEWLESQQVAVDSSQTYMVKSFMYLKAITSGELGWYIDEYNATGNWISGKWVTARYAAATQNVNFTYTPSSTSVKKASLQIYTTANSGVQAYMDNFQFFSLTNNATPPPAANNLLPSGNFATGIPAGWSTDNSAAFTADSTNHGSGSNTANSIKLTSQAANAHLFTPQIAVQSTSTYTVNAYANVATLTSGELAFYIDEYDVSGNWVSGQYAYAKRNASVENVSFAYIPSSATVKKARVQTILTGNSGITGYLDDLQFLAPAGETPPADPTNLVANATFDSGLSAGWTTDSATTITADNANHGSPANPVNSIKLVGTTQNRHLFSPQVAVSSTKSYSLTSWLNLAARTSGEVGFYIDEYDANGNWISGQYKSSITALGSGDRAIAYTPSSATVAKASLQVIVTANSGITAYFDYVRWYQN